VAVAVELTIEPLADQVVLVVLAVAEKVAELMLQLLLELLTQAVAVVVLGTIQLEVVWLTAVQELLLLVTQALYKKPMAEL
jgi:hypothetical protein